MTQAQVAAELPSIQAATTARRVAGWEKPKPERETQEPWFTRSQIEAIHPDDVRRRWDDEIEPALQAGLIDFTK